MCVCVSVLQSLSGHTSPVEAVRFGNAEEMVVAGSLSGALKIWDLEAAKSRATKKSCLCVCVGGEAGNTSMSHLYNTLITNKCTVHKRDKTFLH